MISSVAAVSAPLHADNAAALQQVDQLFDKLPAWFGSMYDRTTGGAHWSTSARQNPQTYPPHIESTSKYVTTLQRLGMVPFTPTPVAQRIIHYTRNKQVGNPSHTYYGFFLDSAYADLDPSNNGATVDSRAAARALGFAVNMLDAFGASPMHPLPSNGQVIGAQPQLASAAAFISYIDSRDWSNVWTAGSDIRHQVSFIQQLDPAKRDEIVAAAIQHLNTHYRDPVTGYWRKPNAATNTSAFIRLNGAMKFAGFYSDLGQTVPHANALANTALNEVQTKIPDNLLHVYNASELLKDITPSLTTPLTQVQIQAFITKQAQNLAVFRQNDGGFATYLSGNRSSDKHPITPAPFSDADASGLALVTRDNLHILAQGHAPPLVLPGRERFFAMSEAFNQPVVEYTFAHQSASPKTLGAITASTFTAVNTNAPTFPASDDGPANDHEFSASGFDDAQSYYTFTLDPLGTPLDLAFLALKMRHSGSQATLEEVRVDYAIAGSLAFTQAGRTRLSGAVMRQYDIPLITIDELQALTLPVTFRIYGLNFGLPGRTLRLDDVAVFASIPEPAALTMSIVGAGILASRPRRQELRTHQESQP